MPAPLFSIITVSLDSAKYIEECIRSVASQTASNWEYIVIDGGSTDGTKAIIDSYKNIVTCAIHGHDDGIYDAMNKGLHVAKGDYVIFLNSDDYLYEDAIQSLTELYCKYRYAYCMGPTAIVDEFGTLREIANVSKRFIAKFDLLSSVPCSHQAFVCSRDLLINSGSFNIKYNIGADYDLMIKVCKNSKNYQIYGSPLAAFRLGGISGNSPRTFLEHFEIRVRNRCNILRALLLLLESLVKFYARRVLPKSFVRFVRRRLIYNSSRTVLQ